MTASILQQLLAIYFAIIYSWQLSSGEKLLVGKKTQPYISRIFADLDFFHKDFFFHFHWEMFVYLVGYAKRILCSEQPTVSLAWRDLSTMLLTNFENLNSISNISQETHDFLVLSDPLIICIYLRTTDRHFRDQRNVLHLMSKLLKCDLVQTLNSFRNPSLRIFAAGKASLVTFTVDSGKIIQLPLTYLYFMIHILKVLRVCFLRSWYSWLKKTFNTISHDVL